MGKGNPGPTELLSGSEVGQGGVSPGRLTGFLVGVSFLLLGTAGEYGTPDEELLFRKCSFRPLMERSSWLERIW